MGLKPRFVSDLLVWLPRLRKSAAYWVVAGAVYATVSVGGWASIPALAALGSAPADSSDAPPPRWPLDLPDRYLTSNFMEHRDGRFHAGLDLKTESMTGFAVRAVEDGYVSRLRTSPTGYGKALYLHGRSGNTYIYAHLERFGDRTRSLVRAEHIRSGGYRVDFYLAPRRLSVVKGEILGLSGQSATNGPHLHFEVRDAEQRPLNPLRFFAVPDSIPPVIEQLRAVPASGRSRINGHREAQLLAATGRRGLLGTLPAVTITGPVAFTARLVDRSDAMGHRLEPYTVRLLLDGQEVFAAHNDRFTFAGQSQMRLEWLQTDERPERWLHRRSANRLDGRSGAEWFGGPDGRGLAAGEHRLTLIAVDHAGNRTECNWSVRVVAGATGSVAADGDTAYDDTVGTGDRSDFDGRSAAEPVRKPSLTWCRAPAGAVWPGHPDIEPLVRFTPLVGPRLVAGAGPVTDGSAVFGPFSDRVLDLSPAAGDPVYEPVRLFLLPGRVDTARVAAEQALHTGDQATWYLAGDWPLRAPVPVPLPGRGLPAPGVGASPQPPAGVGVYRFAEDRWVYEDEPAVASNGIGWIFPLVNPGRYALMRDTTVPEIECWERPRPIARGRETSKHGVALPVWEVLRISISDQGAGVDPGSIRVWLDSETLIAEPDLPRDRVLIELPDDLPAGDYLLGIEVADRAGNVAMRTLPLVCH